MENYNSARVTTPLQTFDSESALKLSESRSVIDNFFYDFCGLNRESSGAGVTIMRVSRPIFTYEFAKDLSTRIYIEVNRITARTSFGADKLAGFVSTQCDTMSRWFAVEAMHRMISNKAWKAILELGQLHPESIVEDSSGKVTGKSKWLYTHGINWTYNDPVNDDMLDIVKELYGLERESFGQDSKLSNIFWSVRIFIEGGLTRSKDALTLDHEKMIHKESVIMNGDRSSSSNEGLLGRIKNGLGKMV